VFWIAAAILLLVALSVLKSVLLPFIAGIVIAYSLSPIADRLVAMGLNRTAVSGLLVVLGAAFIITACVVLLPLIVAQSQQMAAALPGQIEQLHAIAEVYLREKLGIQLPGFKAGLSQTSEAMAGNWSGLASWLASSVWGTSRAVINFISLALVTPLVVFYLLVDWHAMLEKIDGWLPRDHAETIRALATEVNSAVAAFVRGQGAVCVVLGAFYAVALSFIGINYGLLIGVITGVLTFVPFVGWALGFIASAALAIVQFWPDATPLAMVAGVFLAGQALDAAVLSPKIVGSKIGLHPVWLIFALLVFSYLFGFVGVLVAVPVAAAIAVLVRFALRVYLDSDVYRGEGQSSATQSIGHSASSPPPRWAGP
jgi:predicted PurR-regulated permease PerM